MSYYHAAADVTALCNFAAKQFGGLSESPPETSWATSPCLTPSLCVVPTLSSVSLPPALLVSHSFSSPSSPPPLINFSHMCRSLDPPVCLSASVSPRPSVCQNLSPRCHFKSVCHPTLSLMPSVGHRWLIPPMLPYAPFYSSVWPVRDDERRRSPAALLSVIFISSAHLHFVMYQQCARLLACSGTPPLCCAASRLSLLSAHTSDSPLFLEERMKKGQLRGWEHLEMCSCSLLSALSAPLSLCLPLSVCSPPSRPRRFLSSVTSRSLTNTLWWCSFVICPCKTN